MQKIAHAIAENITGNHDSFIPEEDRFTLDDVPDLSGKVAVVTGGTEGIGYAISHVLLANNIDKLFVISKDEVIYSNFLNNIATDLGDDSVNRIVWKQCELSSMRAVAAVADQIAAEADRLHILINNAGRGIMSVELSEDGIDMHMATNHFSHALLTSRLLPLLKRTAETDTVRIVNTSSLSHTSAPKNTKFASLEEINTDHGGNEQYGQSKLATLLHTRWLASRLRESYPNLFINASHPGVVNTRQPREHVKDAYPVLGNLMQALRPAMKDVFEGCVSTVWCATLADRSGEYVCVPKVLESGSEEGRDMELAENLMRLTKEVLLTKTGITMEDI